MHTIDLSVADDDDGADNDATMVVVYDPDGGFVTAGGFFDSPAGALSSAPDVADRAHFPVQPEMSPARCRTRANRRQAPVQARRDRRARSGRYVAKHPSRIYPPTAGRASGGDARRDGAREDRRTCLCARVEVRACHDKTHPARTPPWRSKSGSSRASTGSGGRATRVLGFTVSGRPSVCSAFRRRLVRAGLWESHLTGRPRAGVQLGMRATDEKRSANSSTQAGRDGASSAARIVSVVVEDGEAKLLRA